MDTMTVGAYKWYECTLLRVLFHIGYDESVDPSIANSFATASFRFGHSTVANTMERIDHSGNPLSPFLIRDRSKLMFDVSVDYDSIWLNFF